MGYDDPTALRERLVDLLRARYPACLADRGYVAGFDPDTGAVRDASSRHLVATCRYVSNFALGVRHDGVEPWLTAAAHGLDFLERDLRADDEAYRWQLAVADDGLVVADTTRSTYGHAFVVLAHARAAEAGIGGSGEGDAAGSATAARPAAVADAFLDRFFEPDHGLFRSDLDPDGEPVDPYRGQNANMHACEALLAAHRATDGERFLARAADVASGICVDLASETDGLLWEHYAADWRHDFEYNRDTPADQFRPWGYQPGHHAEWAKLLAELDRAGGDLGDVDAVERATELFDAAIDLGWDDDRGGFRYVVEADGTPVVDDRYGWTVAEAIGAAAALFERTGDDRFRDWHDRLWEYADAALVGESGMWYEAVDASGTPLPPTGGPAVEPDYHPIGACHAGIEAFTDED